MYSKSVTMMSFIIHLFAGSLSQVTFAQSKKIHKHEEIWKLKMGKCSFFFQCLLKTSDGFRACYRHASENIYLLCPVWNYKRQIDIPELTFDPNFIEALMPMFTGLPAYRRTHRKLTPCKKYLFVKHIWQKEYIVLHLR